MLDLAEIIARDKQSSLSGLFVSDEENKVCNTDI
jgi:hypothetical protein